jgi:phosphoglycerate dehydrogenase-like enzyme
VPETGLLAPADLLAGLDLPSDVLVHALGDAMVPAEVLAHTGFYVPRYMGDATTLALMGQMPRLEVCQLLTAGFDSAVAHLPADAVLCNAAGVHDASTAELAVGLMLARLRHLDDFARAMPQGRWAAGRFEALADKRVIIVGFGGVGRAVAARLRAFEVDIVGVGRTARHLDGFPVIPLDTLPGLLPMADVVVLCVPLDEQTRGLVDVDFLAAMRDGALLVNVSRGPIVDTTALLAEVASGRLQAALDVTDPEPLPDDHPLWHTPGVVISPHVGGNTSAFLPRARRLVARQVHRWMAGEPLEHVVARGVRSTT